jgi:hypothetical protein
MFKYASEILFHCLAIFVLFTERTYTKIALDLALIQAKLGAARPCLQRRAPVQFFQL